MTTTLPPVTVLVVGAGNRGSVYAVIAEENPEKCKIVGVCEPRKAPRERMVNRYKIDEKYVFSDWKEAIKLPKFADAVFICTQDKMHKEPAIEFAKLGYHILLEKPMAVNEEDCQQIVQAVIENKTIFAVGHVMVYTPMTQTVKKMIKDGVLGQIIHLQHLEPVGWYHYAHSYVRGNWRNTKESSFMLMTKSCHDIDWIHYIMGEECIKISSFGTRKHFVKENKPKDSSDRCMTCKVEQSCQFSAKKIYLDEVKAGNTGWPVNIIVDEIPNEENVTKALYETNYGRCVYDIPESDVVDSQVVSMQFKSGATATFSMVSTTEAKCIRKTRIFGSKGELEIDGNIIQHFDFLTRKKTVIDCKNPHETKMTGHGGADYYLAHTFIDAVRTKNPSLIYSGPKETLTSHRLVFAAERARLEGKVLDTTFIYE